VAFAGDRHHPGASESADAGRDEIRRCTGPVWAGSLFPFLFITIACGAVSGWHSLISSGTTPKMIENEARFHLSAMAHADGIVRRDHGHDRGSVIHPGVYFAMNSSAG